MALTTSPHASLQPKDDSVLSRSIAAADTTIYVAAQKKWVNGVETTGGFDTSAGFCMLVDGTGRFEYVSYDSKSVNATTFETTLSNCRRGLSPTSSGFGAGTGMTWDANARIFVVDYPVLYQKTVTTDTDQTVAGVKTFSGSLLNTGVFRVPVFANTAARDVVYASPSNGDKAYVTGTGEQVYSAGSWVTVNAASNSLASTTVAGTVEEATAAEIAAATAAGGTGARLFINPGSTAKTSAGPGDENKLPVLGSSGTLAVGFLATGTPTGSKFVRDDGTLQVPVISYFDKTVYASGASSATLSDPTAGTPFTLFDTHTLNIDGTTHVLNATTGYEFEAAIVMTYGASTTESVALRLGTTVLSVCSVNANASADFIVKGFIMGTAAQGASVAVRSAMTCVALGTSTVRSAADYATANVATNGALTLQFAFHFDSSNGSNAATMTMCRIKKFSTTAF